MLNLYLMRHANAAPENIDQDHLRPLSEIGQAEALQAGLYLKKQSITPDMIIHSDAIRTTMTAKLIAQTIDYKQSLVASANLYNASVTEWLETIYSLSDTAKTVIAVGHNLGISRFASYINGDYLTEMDTAVIYGFQFDLDTWQAVMEGNGKFITSFSPG